MLDAEEARHRHEAAVRGHPATRPQPEVDSDGPLQLQVCSLDYSTYIGQLGVGRIKAPDSPESGSDRDAGQRKQVGKAKINQMLTFEGLERVPV
jgi:GTP-binding protein